MKKLFGPIWLNVSLLLFVTGMVGCDTHAPVPSAPLPVPNAPSSAEREELLNAVEQAEWESKNTEPPPPNITLITPDGWSRTVPRPLPPSDNGFTVGYEHDSGLVVTLYQYKRGLSTISDDLDAHAVKEEFLRAKNGIEQAVHLGYWQDAKELESDIVSLGDSDRRALRSQYRLTVDGMTLASEIYFWVNANTFFKVRCTCRSEDVTLNHKVLRPLLSALGSPST